MNNAKYLRTCLRSIQEQQGAAFECVVVDDGSTDNSVAIAEEFSTTDDRFSVVSHEHNRGPSAARNTGLAASSAPFVTFLDADDFLYENSLKSRVDALKEADPKTVAGTYCDWQPTPQDQEPTPPERGPLSRPERLGFINGPECPFIVTVPVVRREVLEQVGGFDEDAQTAEDFDLWLRVLREGYTFAYVRMIGVAYRQNSTGLVFSKSAAHAEASMALIERQYEDVSAEADAPFLSLPLPHYQLAGAKAERLLRTYALAAANGETADVDRIGKLLPVDLHSLERAGLYIDGALRGGVWRAASALPELEAVETRLQLVADLYAQLMGSAS